MSLRKGRHTVSVRPAFTEVTDRGALVQRWAEPEAFQVNVQPVSTAEAEALGLTVATVYRIKYWPQEHDGKPWAGGPYSRITWNGREYDQQGDPMESSMSATTGHTKVLMTARASEVR